MKRIYLLRHGQTDWNKEGRIQGHLEVPLNNVGRDEARRLVPILARLKIDLILSSDLGRAVETAKLAMPSATHLMDARLRETHLGTLQGKTTAEIKAEHGDALWERMRAFPLTDADLLNLGTESGTQVNTRTMEAILDLAKKQDFKSAAIVTHGGVLRNLFRFMGIAKLIPHPIPNAAIFPFSWDELNPEQIQFLEFNPLD